MSPELSLHLEDPERRYAAGGEVRGELRVRGGAGENVSVALDWITEGRGNPEQHEVDAQRLVEGTFDAGDVAHPFRLRLPDAPRAYEGALFRVAYQLRATTGEGGEDETVVLPLRVSSRPPAVEVDALTRGSTGFEKGCLGCSVLLLLQPVAWVLGGERFDSFAGGLLCVLASFGVLGVALSLGTVLAERRLGRVRVDLTPAAPEGYRSAATSPGVDCRVRFRARGASPRAVQASLVVREMTRTSEGSTTRTLRHTLFESQATLEARAPGDHQGRLALPPPGSAPPAFSGRHTSVSWEVRVEVDIPDWPDWTQTVRLPTRAAPPA